MGKHSTQRQHSHRKPPSLAQRILPAAFVWFAVLTVLVVLILSGRNEIRPLATPPNALTKIQAMEAGPAPAVMATATAPESGGDLSTTSPTVRPTGTLTAATSKPTVKPSPTPQPEPVDLEHPYYIVINQGAQLVTIYTLDHEGNYTVPVRYMICSTGERNKTPNGIFRTKTKYRWQRMLASTMTYAQYATRITGSYLFHSVNYSQRRPDALKASNLNNLGAVASGGCVRLQVADAKWIYDNIPEGTPVKIYTGLPQPDITVKLLPEKVDASAKWDPTDPDPNNPNRRELAGGGVILNTPHPGVTPAPLTETFSPDVPRVTRTLPPD